MSGWPPNGLQMVSWTACRRNSKTRLGPEFARSFWPLPMQPLPVPLLFLLLVLQLQLQEQEEQEW